MTASEYLEAVLVEETLAPGGTELAALDEARDDVEAALKAGLGNTVSLEDGGSKAKRTMIRSSYDLDVLCYFSSGDSCAGSTLEEIYESVYEALQAEYVTMRKRSAIKILSLEGEEYQHIDVVPGRYVEGTDGDVYLHHTEGDKSRLKTNPAVHIAHVRDSGVRDAIRLIKLWNLGHPAIKTFVLELLAVRSLSGSRGLDLPGQLVAFWEGCRDGMEGLALTDPANTNNDLSPIFSDAEKSGLRHSAELALERVEHDDWGAIFGAPPVKSPKEKASQASAVAASVRTSTQPWARPS